MRLTNLLLYHLSYATRLQLISLELDRAFSKSDLAGTLSSEYADIWQFRRSIYPSIFCSIAERQNMSLNHELVKEGWCWWYRKYAP